MEIVLIEFIITTADFCNKRRLPIITITLFNYFNLIINKVILLNDATYIISILYNEQKSLIAGVSEDLKKLNG